MPELPEAEVVRRGLQTWVVGRTIADVDVPGTRVLRRYPGTSTQFAEQLRGAQLESAQRRGKFLWLPITGQAAALVAHLGMSGQLVLPDPVLPDPAPPDPAPPDPAPPTGGGQQTHVRVRLHFEDAGRPLHFVDQRTFGWMTLEPLILGKGERLVPQSALDIAIDPFEDTFDVTAVSRRLRRSTRAVKAALLDQNLVSGIGNIYADEALWRARRHWATPANRLSAAAATQLLHHARDVMAEALQAGGTSFDSLYVNVNGQSGYFSRSLNAYGRQDEPCPRCGAPIVRESFANRSSFRCPRCQRRPALRRSAAAPQRT